MGSRSEHVEMMGRCGCSCTGVELDVNICTFRNLGRFGFKEELSKQGDASDACVMA